MRDFSNVVPFDYGEIDTDLIPLLEAFLFTQEGPVEFSSLVEMFGCQEDEMGIAIQTIKDTFSHPSRGLELRVEGEKIQIIPKHSLHEKLKELQGLKGDHLTAIVDEFLYVMQSRGNSDLTVDRYNLLLKRFVTDIGKPVDEITTRDIRGFLMREKTERGNSRNTIATKVATIKSFFKWLELEEHIAKDPTKKIEKPKEDKTDPKFLSHEEIEMMRETAKKPIDRALVDVLYSSGVRVSEAVGLDWDDVDFQNRTLKVTGKGGKTRTTLLSTKAVMLLERYRETRDDNDSHVFRSQYKQRMSKDSIERRIGNIGKKAGIRKKITPHMFRHSFGTHLLEAGMKIDEVQQLLGHQEISTTQIYARTNKADVMHSYRKIFT